MCYIRYLTVTQLRSATATCPTLNRTWIAIINPFCTKWSCHLKHATQCRKPLKTSVIYQATVTTENIIPPKTYVGLKKNPFKTRCSNHKRYSLISTKGLSPSQQTLEIWNLKDIKSKNQCHIEKKIKRIVNLCLWEANLSKPFWTKRKNW